MTETPSKNEVPQLDKEELRARVKSFNEELLPLLAKYRLGIGAIALLLPDGRIAAKPQIFDDSAPQESAEALSKSE